MTSKKCDEVVQNMKQIFYLFGAPKILQTDNGGEFTGKCMEEALHDFPNTKRIRGRARHPQSQGLIERANQTLENRVCMDARKSA